MDIPRQNSIYWHADDLGLSPGITQSIEACFDVINSVSVIVNGTDLNGAAHAIRQYDKAHPENPMRVVLHLNFIEGAAIGGKSIICPHGVFEKSFLPFWQYAWKNRRDKVGFCDAIYAETLCQIQAFERTFGYKPKAMDSHQHMHMIPVVATGVARACAKAGIFHIRIPDDCMWIRSPIVNTGKYGLLKFLAHKTRHIWKQYGITSPTQFFGVLPTGTANPDIYMPVVQRWHYAKLSNPVEILFHPGKAHPGEYEIWHHRPDLWKYYHNRQRDKEATALRCLRCCTESIRYATT